MSDESGSSGKRKASKISEISEPSFPKVIRDNDSIYGTSSLTESDTLDGWDKAQQQDGKPKIEPKNTDDRTMSKHIWKVMEILGYKTGDTLPETDGIVYEEDTSAEYELKLDEYPDGMVAEIQAAVNNAIGITIEKRMLWDNRSTRREKEKTYKLIADQLKDKWGKTDKKAGVGGRKKRRRKTRRRKKSRRKRKTKRKKRKQTRKKRKKRRKRKTRR
jgi:hypothetical protein